MLEGAGLVITRAEVDRFAEGQGRMSFDTWTGRAGTPPDVVATLRGLFLGATPALAEALDIQVQGGAIGFTLPKVEIVALRT
jgi:hypothetical protein